VRRRERRAQALLVGGADAGSFDSGGIQTLMSVDADRVVALASSAHELWSLPVQIVIALVLLYTQARVKREHVHGHRAST
jgi:ATP-binding cassette subfamily C (CFTR/MRP) protein 10